MPQPHTPLSSFLQWYRSRAGGKGTGKQWVYAAGHPVLLTEVEDFYRRPNRFGLIPYDTVVLEGKGLDWSDVQAAFRSVNLQRSWQLVVIRDGHLVDPEVWLQMHKWYPKKDIGFAKTRSVLVTTTERWNTRDQSDSRYLTFRANYATHIECRLAPEKQFEYVKLKLMANRVSAQIDATAHEIVRRCGGDLNRLKSECEKLIVYCGDRAVTLVDVDTVITPSPGELFVDALIVNQKADACARAPYVGSLPFVLGSLDRRLGTLFMIRVARDEMRRPSTKAIADRINVPFFEVRMLEGIARTYDVNTVKRRTHALVQAYRHMASARDESHPEWTLLPLIAAW